MSETTYPTKAEVLSRVDAGWNDLQNYLASLSFEQVLNPTDAAGWTAKDHLTHLAAWEDSVWALLEGKPRAEYMGLTPELWATEDYDAINAVLRDKYKDMDIGALRGWFFGVHERLVEKVRSLPEAELMRPYNTYQPGSKWDLPAIHWVIIDTYEHYEEHREWIANIVSGWVMNKAQLVEQIEQGWNALHAYLATLSDAQLTGRTDAAGWTVKDHLMHLAVWEDGVLALLEGESRSGRMGLTRELFEGEDFDAINAVIYEKHKELTLSEVKARYAGIHERLLARIEAVGDEGLQRPYNAYDPTTPWERPVLNSVAGNTSHHYGEHLPWMREIAEG